MLPGVVYSHLAFKTCMRDRDLGVCLFEMQIFLMTSLPKCMNLCKVYENTAICIRIVLVVLLY